MSEETKQRRQLPGRRRNSELMTFVAAHIPSRLVALVDAEAEAEAVSRSEIVRRAIAAYYRGASLSGSVDKTTAESAEVAA